MVGPNDATRMLIELIMSREVIEVLDDCRQTGSGGVLIGALGLSFHAKPRYSNGIDLFMPESFDRPELSGFERVGQRTLIHRQTGTKLRLLAPHALGSSATTVTRIVSSTTTSAGLKIASRAGLIATLFGDRRAQASADNMALLRLSHVDLIGWDLAQDQLDRVAQLQVKADDESRCAIAWKARTDEPW